METNVNFLFKKRNLLRIFSFRQEEKEKRMKKINCSISKKRDYPALFKKTGNSD